MDSEIKADIRNKLSPVTTILALLDFIEDPNITGEQRVVLQDLLVDTRKQARRGLDHILTLI